MSGSALFVLGVVLFALGIAVSIALQALWLWVCYGPVQDYWTVP